MTFKMIISSKQKRNYINARNVTDCLSSFGGVLLLLFVCISSAQADPLIKIADDVVSQTAVGVPTAKNKPNPTRYNLWMYQNFMIMEGMDALGEVTGNESYKNYTKRSIDFFAAYQSKFGDSMKGSGKGTWYYQATTVVADRYGCNLCRAPQDETEPRVCSWDENCR